MSTAGQPGAATRTGVSTPGASTGGQGGASTATVTSGTSGLSNHTATGTRSATARRVKLTVGRVDPWSVMKMSFLVSVAIGIAGVILMAVLWLILSGMGVFADINRTVDSVVGNSGSKFDLMDYIGFGRVVSLSIVIGVIDVILMTAIATLGAFLYNVCSSLVGGLQLTLTDD